MWPNQRKTGSGALRGDFCRLGGGVGMLSGDKRLRVWATLLEECMSGPETERSSSEAKSRSARPATLTTTMSIARPKLPSVLPSQPALQDGMCIRSCVGRYCTWHAIVVSTTKEEINTGVARATNPVEWVERLLVIYDCGLTF